MEKRGSEEEGMEKSRGKEGEESKVENKYSSRKGVIKEKWQ